MLFHRDTYRAPEIPSRQRDAGDGRHYRSIYFGAVTALIGAALANPFLTGKKKEPRTRKNPKTVQYIQQRAG